MSASCEQDRSALEGDSLSSSSERPRIHTTQSYDDDEDDDDDDDDDDDNDDDDDDLARAAIRHRPSLLEVVLAHVQAIPV